MAGERQRFALFPVRISEFDGTWWQRTGSFAWLRRVRQVDTIWGERFFAEPKPISQRDEE